MAKGSERLTWIHCGGKQPCACCGRSMLIGEVGELAEWIEAGVWVKHVFCRDCSPLKWRAA